MTAFLDSQLRQVAIGYDAGWALTFHEVAPSGAIAEKAVVEFGSRDYHATIEATLPEGLAGGAYRFVVEGLTDEQHAAIRPRDGAKPMVARLHLFWRDANTSVGSYLTNLVGVTKDPAATAESLVAVCRVVKATRKVGTRREETEIVATEAAFVGLGKRVRATFEADDFRAALARVSTDTGVPIRAYPTGSGPLTTPREKNAPGSEKVTLGEGLAYREAVARIAVALAHNLGAHGRGMALIRDGVVHVGKRPVPLTGTGPKDLTLATGLLDVAETGQEDSDPLAAPEIGEPAPTKRTVYTLTLKGRADLKPGDVVTFEPGTPDDGGRLGLGAALAGGFAAPFLPSLGGAGGAKKTAYVTTVRHTLSRTAGFVTVATAVGVAGIGDAAWDAQVDGSSAPAAAKASASGDAKVAAAEAVVRAARMARGETRTLEVGEVRAAATAATGAVEPPAQTVTVWEGLAAPDGRPNGARRLPIRREHPSPQVGVPYATPFAWGKTGLVVPRYPGTRVVLGYRNGLLDDPVDLGAVWASGRGPVSEPGDWWLSLPVDVPADRRSSVAEGATPAEPTGKVTHDLIDGAGNRVIEVGELTVRVGKGTLGAAGDRPKRPTGADAGAVTIEHTAKHSKIVMRQDGSILITGTSIELDAGSGSITLKADTVDVQVTSAMEVH